MGMGKVTDGVRKFAKKMGGLRWPKRKPTISEKRQVERWEGEGGSLPPDEQDPR